jgi:organic hydroperoxide reductase OsmC/OhrA
VVAYEDEATAVMPEDDPPTRVTQIVLRPVITVVGTDGGHPTDERLAHLCEVAHRECFIANSLRAALLVEPTFQRRA